MELNDKLTRAVSGRTRSRSIVIKRLVGICGSTAAKEMAHNAQGLQERKTADWSEKALLFLIL